MGISIFGLYPALKLMQFHAEEVMEDSLKQNLPDGQLTVFKDLHHNKDIAWERDDEEFHYRGDMYDVVRTEHKDGSTLYYCLSDKKEAEICALMQKVAGNNALGHANTQKVVKLFIQVFTPCERYHYYISHPQDHYAAQYNHYTCHYSDCFIKVTGPPPKIV